MENIFINFDISKIEFDKILKDIANYAVSDAGKNAITNIKIENNYDNVLNAHKLLTQLKNFFITDENISLNVIFNFDSSLIDSIKNRVIDEISLYRLAYSVDLYFKLRKKLKTEKYPDLINLFNIESLSSPFYKDILKYINDEGYVDSRASRELANIRDSIAETEGRIKKVTDSYFKKMQQAGYTVDDLVSYKDGYNAIAIKPNYKNKVDAVVIETSGSGQTVYVVPNAVLSLHNELMFLKDEEKKEIYRICREYTEIIKTENESLTVINSELIAFDILYAKTKYSYSENLNSPEIIRNKRLNIINGRHPLLGKNAVPLNISLGDDYKILIITGPNTGGKTVVLKTIGLFALMVQSGIAIPASSSSQFAVFDRIFFDIGDEQSIEQSLSTFSAHILKIKDIIKKSDSNSLILMDEFCSGTDPAEGSALAVSIIEKLLQLRSLGVFTTHYSSLKIFASQKDGVQNASMEFDNDKLIPTYKLLIGIPGNSKAFDISRRLGIPDEIIDSAIKNMDKDYLNVEKLLIKLENERKEFELKNSEYLKLNAILGGERNDLEIIKEDLAKKEKEIKDLFKKKESLFLIEARKDLENLIKQIKTENASKESIQESKSFISAIDDRLKEYDDDDEVPDIKIELKKGDEVLIVSNNVKGFVVDRANSEDQYIIQTGFIKMNFNLSELKLLHPEKEEEKVYSYNYDSPKKQLTLDIRGQRFEVAERMIEKFIEESLTSKTKTVKVIHGMGTGALRSCLHDFCSRSPYVLKFEYEKAVESNSTNFGVTVVYLK